MKRRIFILSSAGLAACGLIPGKLFAALSGNFIKEPYDDNRVIRVYDPAVSEYGFSESKVYWKSINREVLRSMIMRSIYKVSGETTVISAWRKILAGNIQTDVSNKKVVIKVNFNNSKRDIFKTLNNSPAMIIETAKSLMQAGIQENNICFFDCSRPFPDVLKNEVRKGGLKEVELIGNEDEFIESGKSIFLSDNAGHEKDDLILEKYPIPQLLIDADYLINLHLVKIHQTGVTGAMKNLYGISNVVATYVHYEGVRKFEVGNHLPDISLNEDIKKRARLNIAEFIFGGHTPDTIDRFTNEDFYPSGIPASLVVSRSPFYHDLVLYNYIKAKYETCVSVLSRYFEIGPDTWLSNSAEEYAPWVFEKADFVETKRIGRPAKDLSFQFLDYISV